MEEWSKKTSCLSAFVANNSRCQKTSCLSAFVAINSSIRNPRAFVAKKQGALCNKENKKL
jgi:hypothetical protein